MNRRQPARTMWQAAGYARRAAFDTKMKRRKCARCCCRKARDRPFRGLRALSVACSPEHIYCAQAQT
eukprot:6438210-Prymnesium_polylepis.2